MATAFKGFFNQAKERVAEKVQNVNMDDYKQKMHQAASMAKEKGGDVGSLFT